MAKHRLMTAHYQFDECASALQKAIRRRQSREAVIYVTELVDRFPLYVFRRLPIIVTEDIGIANLALVHEVLAMSNLASMYTKADMVRRLRPATQHLVWHMAESEKSREADNLFHAVARSARLGQLGTTEAFETYEDGWREFAGFLAGGSARGTPIDAAVLATFAGFRLENGYAEWMWMDLAAHAAQELSDPDAVSAVVTLSQRVITALRQSSQGGQYEPHMLALVSLIFTRYTETGRRFSAVETAVSDHELEKLPEIPDVALDMHTGRGASRGRNVLDFWMDGAKLVPEPPPSEYVGWDDQNGDGFWTADLKKTNYVFENLVRPSSRLQEPSQRTRITRGLWD